MSKFAIHWMTKKAVKVEGVEILKEIEQILYVPKRLTDLTHLSWFIHP